MHWMTIRFHSSREATTDSFTRSRRFLRFEIFKATPVYAEFVMRTLLLGLVLAVALTDATAGAATDEQLATIQSSLHTANPITVAEAGNTDAFYYQISNPAGGQVAGRSKGKLTAPKPAVQRSTSSEAKAKARRCWSVGPAALPRTRRWCRSMTRPRRKRLT